MVCNNLIVAPGAPQSLRDLYREHTGKVSDKWEIYLDVYDATFAPWRALPISFVEVGVQNGGSLEIWAKYFANARAITGCDVNPRCGALRFDDPRVSVVVGPVNTATTAREIAARAGHFDIFVDDGSHVSPDIIAAFCNYFPYLRPGGLYVVEDLHCAYMPKWSGGIDAPNAVAFFKMLVDGLHHHYWEQESTMEQRAAAFMPAGSGINFTRLAEAVASIAFYDSLAIVQKRPANGWGRLGKPVVAGNEAAVDPEPLQFRNGKEGAQKLR
jgi:SAM-dependent methyltransferase